MKRVVVRPRIQTPLLVVCLGLFAFIGVGILFDGDPIAQRDWGSVGIGALVFVFGVIGVWRAVRMGVVIDERGVRIRSFDSRDKLTPWSMVESVECVQVDERMGMAVYAPILVLGRETGALPVTALGSYSPAGAERQTDRLRALRDGASATAQTATPRLNERSEQNTKPALNVTAERNHGSAEPAGD